MTEWMLFHVLTGCSRRTDMMFDDWVAVTSAGAQVPAFNNFSFISWDVFFAVVVSYSYSLESCTSQSYSL